MKRTTPLAGILLLLTIQLPGCGDSGGNQAELDQALNKLNKGTMSVAVALESMRTNAEMYADGGRTPMKVELEMWWISLTSTRLNLSRIKTLVIDNPQIVPEARNLWSGRIQGNIDLILENGMLTTMKGTLSSRVIAEYGEERVRKEADQVIGLSEEIEALLGIEPDASEG